jgi:hypothetical protein
VGLSESLVTTLEALVTHIPTLVKEIQLRLMDILSNILAKKPYMKREESFGSPLSKSTGTAKYCIILCLSLSLSLYVYS